MSQETHQSTPWFFSLSVSVILAGHFEDPSPSQDQRMTAKILSPVPTKTIGNCIKGEIKLNSLQ